MTQALREPRKDTLPEGTKYLDTGCDAAPRCLSCPLPACVEDGPGGPPKPDIGRELWKQGATLKQISVLLHVSERAAYRYTKAQRGGGA